MSETKSSAHEHPQLQAQTEDFTGRTLANYVLIRRLGRGGMADVYLAQQTTLNRPVAIKILKPELARDRSYVKRFHREAQAAATLVQANIVQIYEVGESDGLHFIAQEYVRGQNLRQYLYRNQIVEPILAVSIIRQAAAALQKAREHGVIHRDIKPENIMITPSGEVKVTDFGLARLLDDQRTELTQIGITMGTPLYMSPEQAEGSRVDSRSDLYSLGITAYHMLTGRPPFEAENALAVAVQHVKQDPQSLNVLRPDLPVELCDIIHKLIAKNPNDRFQDPIELQKELRKIEIEDITDWDQLTEKLSTNETIDIDQSYTVPQTRLEVTRQLETIMTGHFRPWWRTPWLIGGIVLMAAFGGLIGALIAFNNPPPDPLVVKRIDDGMVPKKENAQEQYFHAVWNAFFDNEQEYVRLFAAVAQHYPEYSNETGELNKVNQYWIRKANVRLGEFYLEIGNYDKAYEVFDELASLEETEAQLILIGMAGLAYIHDQMKEKQEAIDFLRRIQPDYRKLNEFMRRKIENLFIKYQPRPPKI